MKRKRSGSGKLLNIVQRSPERINAPCPFLKNAGVPAAAYYLPGDPSLETNLG